MKAKSFEEKLEKIKSLLEKLTDPEITLDQSVKFYEEGIKEIQEAQTLLEEAKMKVETIEQAMQKGNADA